MVLPGDTNAHSQEAVGSRSGFNGRLLRRTQEARGGAGAEEGDGGLKDTTEKVRRVQTGKEGLQGTFKSLVSIGHSTHLIGISLKTPKSKPEPPCTYCSPMHTLSVPALLCLPGVHAAYSLAGHSKAYEYLATSAAYVWPRDP